MLGIGLAMVASLANYHREVSIHRPLGTLILIVVVIRYINRRYSTLPPFPATMSQREQEVGSLHFFPILPQNVMLYAVLRRAHTVLAYLLFLTFLAHFGAVLFHTWVLRDGTFSRMAPWRARAH